MNNNLQKTGIILLGHKSYMKMFMNNYIFKQLKINTTDVIQNKDNFLKIIDFCLQTRQRIITVDYNLGKDYFSDNYKNLIQGFNEGNINSLKSIVYECKGVGQKIGSFILEVFIHYLGNNQSIQKELFLPIDTHTKRVLEDSFNIIVPKIGSKISDRDFLEFQTELDKIAPKESGRIIFDYLWFIGKVFCQKITYQQNAYSRGFRLCESCWIRETCQHHDKWEY